jgi:hypothetical protein
MKTFLFFFILAVVGSANLQAQSATFESIISGTWAVASTWSITSGSDPDGLPDSNDDVIIKAGHTISLSKTANAKTLDIQVGGGLNGLARRFNIYGNLNMAGPIANGLELYIYQDCILSTPSTTYAAKGNIYVLANRTLTLTAGSTINKQGPIHLLQSNAKIVNQGVINLTTNGTSLGTIRLPGANSVWTNDGAATLTMVSPATAVASASMNATGVGSTVNYNTSSTFVVPGVYYNLNINSSGAKTLSGNLTVLNDISMGASGTNSLVLNGFQLNIAGNATLNAPITGTVSGSKVSFNGASAATQSITGTRSISTYSMEVNTPAGGVFINTTQQNRVFNTLTLIDGDFNANGRLTLESDASTTARIAPVLGGNFTGNIVMEKYFAGSAAKWFDLSSPAESSTVSDWDNELYISGIGAYDGIGGPQGVDGDVVSTNNPTFNYVKSMNTYDEPTASYVGVTGSGTGLTPGIGYNMWFEDDVNDVWTAKVINTIGIPNKGDITLNLGRSGPTPYEGYHLIGNPYASAIDLSLIYDFSDTYYNNMDLFSVEVLDGSATGNFTLIDAISSGAIIYPHQGFWVRALAGGGTFTFHEGCKVSDVTTAVNQRHAANYDIKLMLTSPTTNFYHENFVNFNNAASVNYDKYYDAPFRYSPIKEAPALFMQDGSGKMMTKNAIDNLADEVVIPLGLYTPQTAVYYVEASVLNMDSYNYAWIENMKTGKQFDLNSNSIAIEGEEGKTNTDYVLHLSKTKKSSAIASTILESDLMIFNTENTINLKSTVSSHNLSELTIYDMTGKLVLSQTNMTVELGNVTKIDVSNLSNGVYVVNAIDVNGKSISKKLVK